MYNNTASNIDARYNYWNTTDTTTINIKIWDYYDDFTKGKVFYKPFLTDSLIFGVEENAKYQVLSAELEISPNPFLRSTTIKYSIPAKSYVSLKIYDITGREIKTLVNTEKETGSYKVSLNAKRLSTGIYFAKFEAGNYKETKKLVLVH